MLIRGYWIGLLSPKPPLSEDFLPETFFENNFHVHEISHPSTPSNPPLGIWVCILNVWTFFSQERWQSYSYLGLSGSNPDQESSDKTKNSYMQKYNPSRESHCKFFGEPSESFSSVIKEKSCWALKLMRLQLPKILFLSAKCRIKYEILTLRKSNPIIPHNSWRIHLSRSRKIQDVEKKSTISEWRKSEKATKWKFHVKIVTAGKGIN